MPGVDDPRWFGLMAVGALCALLGWRWMRAVPRLRRATAVLARVALIAAASLALAGLHTRRPADRVAVIGVVDLSRSVRSYADFGRDESGARISARDAAWSLLAQASAGREGDDPFGLVVFDGRTTAVATPTRADPLARSAPATDTDGTDIRGAIDLARAMLPGDARPRLVLISDGRPTTGALDTIAPGVPVDVAPIVYRVERETVVESFDLPPRSMPGAIVDGRVVLRASAGARGVLTLLRDGRPVDLTPDDEGTGLRVEFDTQRAVVPVRFTVPDGRVHRYEAVYEPDRARDGSGEVVLYGDTSVTNNSASAFTLTRAPGSVLVVDGNGVSGESTLVRTLRAAGRTVEVLSPAAFPTDLLTLEGHDLVILDNVAIDTLPSNSDAVLDAYTRTFGGGVVMVGGRRALTAGGWRGSAFEDALPVALEIPDRVVMPETAVVIVLDQSGSMRNSVLGSSRSQQDVANAAAAAAIDTLDPNDLVGVIAFSNNAQVVVPLGPNEDPESTRDAVLGITSDGGTHLPRALDLAIAELARVETKSKHVIVLSDGESQNPERLPGQADQLQAQGVRVSTIAVGDGADAPTLRTVAERGGGVFYRVTNPSGLPQVFIKAVRVMREPAVRDTPFDPITVDPDAPLVSGVGTIPTLGGVVLSTRKTEASTPVVTPDDEPVVASWPVELGRVAVVATDASDWAGGWIASPGFARFWTNTSAWAARAIEDAPGELRLTPTGADAELVYEAQDDAGAPIDGLDVSVNLYLPDGSVRSETLRQTGPGRYEGSASGLPDGVVVAASRASLAGSPLAPSVSGVQIRAGAEDLALSSDEAGLAELARRTGGRVLDWSNPQPLFAREGPERIARSALWPMLLVVTLVLFLIDVAMRRLAWDRWVDSAREGTLAATATQGASLADLRAARTREAPAPLQEVPSNADAERRRIERERLQRQMAEARARAAGGTPAASAPSNPEASAEPEAEESGLLAAKRRARKRFEE